MGVARIYRRVSGDESFEFGTSMAAQLGTCMQWIEKTGVPFGGVYGEDEALSGATEKEDCPGLLKLLADLQRGDYLVVQKRERLSRSRLKTALLERELAKLKVRIISATGEGTDGDDPHDPSTWMLRAQIDTFAEFEVMMARWRTRNRLQQKRAQNERTGGVPFGWDLVDDGKRSKPRRGGGGNLPIGLVANAAEQAIVLEMRQWKSEGRTLRRIAAELNGRGVMTKSGKPWAPSSVAWILAHSKVPTGGEATKGEPGRPAPIGDHGRGQPQDRPAL